MCKLLTFIFFFVFAQSQQQQFANEVFKTDTIKCAATGHVNICTIPPKAQNKKTPGSVYVAWVV